MNGFSCKSSVLIVPRLTVGIGATEHASGTVLSKVPVSEILKLSVSALAENPTNNNPMLSIFKNFNFPFLGNN